MIGLDKKCTLKWKFCTFCGHAQTKLVYRSRSTVWDFYCVGGELNCRYEKILGPY